MAVLCAASVGKALCGVVAGGAKASLSGHFAVKGDVGELSAVDASQETVVGLVGMLVCFCSITVSVSCSCFFWPIIPLIFVWGLSRVGFSDLGQVRSGICRASCFALF